MIKFTAFEAWGFILKWTGDVPFRKKAVKKVPTGTCTQALGAL